MDKTANSIEAQILALPFNRRAELADQLLSSLESRDAAQAREVEAAWVKEADRRYQALISGEDIGLSHEEVFSDLCQDQP